MNIVESNTGAPDQTEEAHHVTMATTPQRPQPAPYTYDIHAGDLIRAEIAAVGLSQAELSARTGLSTKHVNQVIKGVVPLSTDAALKVERATGISADLLTAIEAAHQAAKTRTASRERLGTYADWFKQFPIKALRDRNVVHGANLNNQIEELLNFFGVADPEAFERLYAEAALSFRRAQHLKVDPKATATWLRLAEQKALHLDVEPYEKKKFKDLVDELPPLTKSKVSKAFPELQAECARVGVAVVFVPDVTGARACAATRWIAQDRPVIALSGRGQYEDGFWFNFFHECGHILLHPKRRSVVHLSGDGDDNDGAESEANQFARSRLLRGADMTVLDGVATHDQVKHLARRLDVHPGIIAAQIAYHRGGDNWRKYHPLRRQIDLEA